LLFLQSILGLAAPLQRCWQMLRGQFAHRGALDALSSATLRDLAIDRSELRSIEAEACHLVPLTRRRIVDAKTKSYAGPAETEDGSNAASNARYLCSTSLSTFNVKEI
jgi:uncharacterized protein YjiS (DUF1127 family)